MAAMAFLASTGKGATLRASSSGTVPAPKGIPGNWRLALNSTFTGTSLPSPWRKGWWGRSISPPVQSQEDDCYSGANVSLSGGGSLLLSVTRTPSECRQTPKQYTGAIITTNPNDGRRTSGFEYTYGVAQALIYVPGGQKIADWPAFWADSQSYEAGEDDVMEGLAGNACFHFHDALGGPGTCDWTLKPGWHTFASLWRPGSVTYYYDGHPVGTIARGITSAPMYLILDMTTLAHGVPATMRVKYVRVWQSAS